MIWRSEFIRVYVVTMLMALLLWSCTSDDITTPSGGRKGVSLAFNISTGRAGTRMSTLITHQVGENDKFRDIMDLRLFPFGTQAIASETKPLSAPLNQMTRYEDADHRDLIYYYDNGSLEIPDGTSAFLCYCRENPLSGESSSGIERKFKYGTLTTEMDTQDWSTAEHVGTATAADIRFEPEKIYNSDVVDERASNIAEYLTSVAQAIQGTPGKEDLYRLFTNGSSSPDAKNHTHLLACSSTNVMQLAAWVEGQGVVVSPFDFEENNYPAAIHLPDGVAVVKWDNTEKKFVPQTATTTEANINNLNRFVYPPELYYYANSGIKTSPQNLYEELNQKTWEEVLAKFDKGLGTVDGSVNSIAINDPLAYAVGCLQLGFYVPSTTLSDAKGTAVPLTSGTGDDVVSHFPLTSLLVSSQHPQDYKFEPVDGTSDEYIVYDKEDIPAIKLGSAKEQTPADNQFTNTLVLQTKDGAPVRFAMEFTNNSGIDFQGINGTVFNGTKFYLVGQIKVPIDQEQDFQKRVFTKNHLTKGVIKISSLKEAYTYLPDLLDPRLEVGIQLIPDWIQSTTINVPL